MSTFQRRGRGVCRASILLGIVLLDAACAAELAHADILYAGTESLGHEVDRVTSAGTLSVFANLPGDSSFAEGVAFDSNNNLFTANDNTDDISKITPGGAVTRFKSLASGSAPDGIAIDAANNLYVANHGTNQIVRITPAGTVSAYAQLGSTASSAGLAFDRGGILYVADANNDVIDRVTPGGVVSLFATLPKGSTPLGMAFDAAGNLFAADLSTDQIARITPNGVVSTFVSLPAGAQPIGLAFDSAGNLYEAGVDRQIRQISATGAVSPFATGGSTFTYLAFTDDAGNRLAVPVPEPTGVSIVVIASLSATGSCRRTRRLR